MSARRIFAFFAFFAALRAQDFSQRGFLDTTLTLYPQTAPADSGRAVAEALLRYEAFYKVAPFLRFSGGVDVRSDTHRQVERGFSLSWQDRNRQRSEERRVGKECRL